MNDPTTRRCMAIVATIIVIVAGTYSSVSQKIAFETYYVGKNGIVAEFKKVRFPC